MGLLDLFMSNKIKYLVIFLQKDKNLLYRVGLKKFNVFKEFVRFKGKTYHIPSKRSNYFYKNTFYYFIDINSQQKYMFKSPNNNDVNSIEGIMDFEESKEFLNANELDKAMETKIFQDLAYGVSRNNQKTDWFSLILGSIIGALLSAIIVIAIFQNKIDSLMNIIATNSQNPIYPF